jgi:hypothetical protein
MSAAVCIIASLSWSTMASATSFTGSPSPSLSPTFGTLINFDDKSAGTAVLANDYVALGLQSVKETEGVGFFARYAGSQSAPNYIGTGVGGERGTDASLGWDGTILFEFANLANKVGIGVADSQGGPEILSIFDASMNLLESFNAPTGSNTYAGFERSAYDIKYFSIKGDFFAVDDLQFNSTSAPVPEPSTVFLLAAGILGMGLCRKLAKK